MPHRGGLVHHSGGHVCRLRGLPHGGRPLGLGHPRDRRSAAAAASSTRSERRGGRGHVDCRPLVGHGVGDRGQGSHGHEDGEGDHPLAAVAPVAPRHLHLDGDLSEVDRGELDRGELDRRRLSEEVTT